MRNGRMEVERHTFLISALDGRERSAYGLTPLYLQGYNGRYTLNRGQNGNQSGTQGSLDDWQDRKRLLPLPEIEGQFLGCPPRSLDTILTELSRLIKVFLKITCLKTPTNALECTNVSLLYSIQRHVSANHVAIFRAARTRIQLQL